jgi:hypothetical protein
MRGGFRRLPGLANCARRFFRPGIFDSRFCNGKGFTSLIKVVLLPSSHTTVEAQSTKQCPNSTEKRSPDVVLSRSAPTVATVQVWHDTARNHRLKEASGRGREEVLFRARKGRKKRHGMEERKGRNNRDMKR